MRQSGVNRDEGELLSNPARDRAGHQGSSAECARPGISPAVGSARGIDGARVSTAGGDSAPTSPAGNPGRRRPRLALRSDPQLAERVGPPTEQDAVQSNGARMLETGRDGGELRTRLDVHGSAAVSSPSVSHLPSVVGAPTPKSSLHIDGARMPPASRDGRVGRANPPNALQLIDPQPAPGRPLPAIVRPPTSEVAIDRNGTCVMPPHGHFVPHCVQRRGRRRLATDRRQ